MFTIVMSCLTLRITILITAIFFINISTKDYLDASSCEVTYSKQIFVGQADEGIIIFCKKTEDSLSDLSRTHLVYRYKCAEDVYENCPTDLRTKWFEIDDCELTPDTFNFCNKYQITLYEKHPGNYKNVVLRNGTFGNHQGVMFILLSENRIQTVESGSFGCLSKLEVLDMHTNDIEELPDDVFRCLPKLEFLNLFNNRISVVPKCLRDLSSLQYLYLSNNLITVFPETALHKSARLKSLNLSRNAIQKFCPTEISQLDDLQDLYLRGNNITSLTSKCFAKQKYLRELDIGMNVGLVLSSDFFAGLDRLDILLIDRCGLSIRAEESVMFYDTTRLTKLELQHNCLREIHSELFQNLRDLENLNLSFNAISVLHNGSFAQNVRLRYLDLSNNILSELKSGEFPSMYSLEILSISNNNIMNVAETVLHDLRNLTTLDISNNNISQIILQSSVPLHSFKQIFRNLKKLEILEMRNVTSNDFNLVFSEENRNIRHLDISFNVGLRLDENSLKNLKNLRTFISRGTNVETLKDFFANNKQLEEVNMSLNKIQMIGYTALGFSKNLRKLDLSWNNISGIYSVCPYCTEMEYFNMSHNALIEMNIVKSFSRIRRINVLDISFNRFTEIQWTSFPSVGNLWASNNNIQELFLSDVESSKIQTVHLEDCQIQKVRLHPTLQMKKGINFERTRIFLTRNPMVCDCHAFQLYEYVKHPGANRGFNLEGLTCRRPVELEGREVINLSPSDFSCEVTRSCPKKCRCLKRALDDSLVVNCSRKDLGSLPENVPANTTILDVSYNRVVSLESLNSSVWENLTEIHAEGNFISSLEFDVPKSLKFFLLHGNRLTKLPEKHTAVIRRALQITLSENPWSCGCESLELKYFLSKPVGLIPDASEVRCAPTTNSTSNLTLLEMKDQDLCPKTETGSSKGTISIILIAVLSVLVFGLSVWLYYIKNDNFVKALLFTHCPCMFRLPGCRKVVEEDKYFDCFISYGSEDVNVPLAIVSAMGEDPNPEFKFCVHDRHWKGGSTISENIFRSVEVSRKTLIVISQTFVKNRWFHLEFQAALMQMLKDRRDRMIFVIKGEMPDYENLPRDVRHFLRTRTYLVWGERWFMEKLRYSLQEESVPLRAQLREFLFVVLNCFRNRRLYHRDLHEEIV